MIRFFILGQVYFFALLFGRHISESVCMNEKIFWKTLNADDFLFVLNVKSVKISPEDFLF
jgi:hypothetical protein